MTLGACQHGVLPHQREGAQVMVEEDLNRPPLKAMTAITAIALLPLMHVIALVAIEALGAEFLLPHGADMTTLALHRPVLALEGKLALLLMIVG